MSDQRPDSGTGAKTTGDAPRVLPDATGSVTRPESIAVEITFSNKDFRWLLSRKGRRSYRDTFAALIDIAQIAEGEAAAGNADMQAALDDAGWRVPREEAAFGGRVKGL